MFRKKAPQYTIKTIQDICQLDPSQLDEFLQDLKTWVLTTKGMGEAFKMLGFPALPDGMMNMIWIDDGKHEYGGVRLSAEPTRDNQPSDAPPAEAVSEDNTDGQFTAESEASGADGSNNEVPDEGGDDGSIHDTSQRDA